MPISYKWKKNGITIPGAPETNAYVVEVGDDASLIKCEVKGTNMIGSTLAYSNSVLIPSPNPICISNPVVSGIPLEGQTLSVTNGTWTGAPTILFDYEWRRNGVAIPGAVFNTYDLEAIDAGCQIDCKLKGANMYGEGEAISNFLIPSASLIPPTIVVPPSITGTGTTAGSVLTINNGTWAGSPTITFSRQWLRNGFPISGETGTTYTLLSTDVGDAIDCVFTATNPVTSVPYITYGITVEGAPVMVQPPVVYGTYSLGGTLTVQVGVYSGYPTPSATHKWQLSTNGGATWTDILGATGTTYVVQPVDVSNKIRVYETVTNTIGTINSTSNVVDIIAAATQRPENTVAPVVSGDDYVGGVLTVTNGTWLNSPTSYNYQWKRGATNVGTNSTTYTQVAADAGFDMSCVVTGVNAGGSEPATSNTVYCYDSNFKNGTTGVIDFATSQGYALPSTAQLRKFNAHLIGLKALGVFTIYDRHWGGVANDGSENFGRINWKGPSLGTLLTPVNSPTWVSNLGYVCNAANSYVSTNYNPAVGGVNYTLNNAGRYFFTNNRTSTAASQTIDGNAAANNDNTMRCANAATQNNINSGTNLGTAANAGGYGFHCITRTASNVVNRHYDLNTSMTTASTAITSSVQFICRSGTTYQSGLPICMYAIGGAVPLASIPSLKALCEQLYFNL